MRCFQWLLLLVVCLSGSVQVEAQTVPTTETAQEIAERIEAVREVSGMELDALITELNGDWRRYERQLQAVLRTRLLEEREFVARLVVLVQSEQIPKSLVDSAWLWVRNNRAGATYPFVYFERIIRLQSERTRIPLPAFDRSVFGNREARNRSLEAGRFR